MTTEITTATGSHSRRTFDDESRQEGRRQLTERSDAGLTEVLRELIQVAAVAVHCDFFKSTFASQILSESRNCGFELKWPAVTIAHCLPLPRQPQHLHY